MGEGKKETVKQQVSTVKKADSGKIAEEVPAAKEAASSVGKTAPPAGKTKEKATAEKDTAAAEKEVESVDVENKPDALGLGDPFVYAGTGNGEFSPFSGNRHVGFIAVRGIIHIEGEEPKAILHLKESDRVHYVSKGSVVRVNSRDGKSTSPAEAYIVVKDIRDDEVELIQLERPDKVIIIR